MIDTSALGPGGEYALLGLLIAGITFAIESLVKPLGKFGKFLYAVAAILIIVWAVILITSLV